ncbi:MAG: BrnT family toxin [Candidatus Tyrphobacter sp.]
MNEEGDGVEWDERKSDLNLELRGFGFDVAAEVFGDDYIESESHGQGFDEPRFVTIGRVDGLVLTVIWTPRGSNRRIISARPASRGERRIYHDHCQKETF